MVNLDMTDHTLDLCIERALRHLGADLDDENLKDTPRRFASVLRMFPVAPPTEKEIKECLSPVFPEDNDNMVLERDLRFQSLCAHHLMPFFGKAYIA